MIKFQNLLLLIVFTFSFNPHQYQSYQQNHKQRTHHHQHNCVHSQIVKKIKNKQAHINRQQKIQFQSDFLSQNPKPIIITYSIHASPSTSFQEIIKIQKLMNVTVQFFRELMKVKSSKKIKFSKNTEKCYQVEVPIEHRMQKMSDLHLFVTTEYQPQQTYLAWATACILDSTNRPIFGQINFNTNYFSSFESNYDFQKNLETTIHQIIHVLGFSQSLFSYWSNPPNIRKNQNTWTYLQTSLMKETMKNHFNCYIGAPIQDQGDDGSKGSHFQRSVFMDQLMTASALPTRTKVTIFTLAVLQSTGWYFQIDKKYAQPFHFGEKKGCNFINQKCKNYGTQSNQYCQKSGQKGCNFQNTAISTCHSDTFSNSCPYYYPYSNAICSEQSHMFGISTASETGPYSRCFQSNFTRIGYSSANYYFRCYNAKCINSQIIITIQGEQFVCKYQKQLVNGKKKITGYLKCPSNFQLFCGVTKQCQNHCNQNGLCLNGKCICKPNTFGQNCDIPCNLQIQYVYSSININLKKQYKCFKQCPPQTLTYQFNKTCLDSCPSNSYVHHQINLNKHIKYCIPCSQNCQQCKNSQSCMRCKSGTYLNNGTGKCILVTETHESNTWNFLYIFLVIILVSGLGYILYQAWRRNRGRQNQISQSENYQNIGH